MFISLLILVLVLTLIFGHSHVKSLMDNVMENRSLLSPLDIAPFRRNVEMILHFEGGSALDIEDESNDSITNHSLDVEFSSDRLQHLSSISSKSERGTNAADDVDDKQNPSMIGNDRTRMNLESNFQYLTRRENLEQLGLELKSAFWGSSAAVRTDTVGTDNKYKGTKEHILQALMDSIQENANVASSTLTPAPLQTENVYSVTVEDACKLNRTQSDGHVNEECEKEIHNKNSPSTSSDKTSVYAECSSSSSNLTSNNNLVEKEGTCPNNR